MVASSTSVGVEVLGMHTFVSEITTSRVGRIDRSCRANMICGDRVTHHQQRSGIHDIADYRWFDREVLEERRPSDVGGFWIPLERIVLGSCEFGPSSIACEHIAIFFPVGIGGHMCLHERCDLLWIGPYVLQVDRIASGVEAKGIV